MTATDHAARVESLWTTSSSTSRLPARVYFFAMAIDPYANCNTNIISDDLCTLETCCLAQSSFLYIPNYGANLFFAILFAVLIVPQLGLGIYYKTWGFMVGMLFGLALEVIGYVARVQLHNNPFNGDAFLM